jgi:hypothetical protein
MSGWARAVFVVLAATSCHRRARPLIEHKDCAGFERYARAQVDEVVARYRASDMTRDRDIELLRALVQRDMNDGRSDWQAETDMVPPDCYVDAIGSLWLRLDALAIALDAAGPASNDRAMGRAGVADGIARLAEPLEEFRACRALLGAYCVDTKPGAP